MLKILSHTVFRRLFIAQIVALIGTGLATVALGLLAFDIAGGDAGLVLGAIFTIKMLAYVLVAPVAGAFADRLPRRLTLISLDLVRAAVAMALPFVAETWQIYLLIALLQSASAAFTPTFQAVIPDILPDEKDYTQALSLSRIAYDLESMISPLLAAAALLLVSYNALFLGTGFGFVVSAAMIGSVVLPNVASGPARAIFDRTTRGIRTYLSTPRLRALLALCFAVSSAVSMVLVNTVVLVQGDLARPASFVALAMAAFGAGSMGIALLLPRLLEQEGDRFVMLPGAALMGGSLAGFALWVALFDLSFGSIVIAWALIGIGYSAVMTPSGRLVKRSADTGNGPELFAAQFALSHACWLVSYPLAGVLITLVGGVWTAVVLSVLAFVSLALAALIWPVSKS